MKKMISALLVLGMMLVCLSGCFDDSPVQNFVVSGTSYAGQEEIDLADQQDKLKANESIFASVSLIESPKGMEYTVVWYIDGTKVQSETKATVNDRKDIVIYELEAEKVIPGMLKVEVAYKDTVLATKELTIE